MGKEKSEKTAIEQYCDDIRSGRAIVGKYIATVYLDMLEPIVLGKSDEFYYDASLPSKFFMFSDKFCVQSKGSYSGKPINYLTFQKAIFEAAFGVRYRANSKFRFTELFIEEARKNGKTTMVTPCPTFDMLREPGAEDYVVATKLDQARHLWNETAHMVAKSEALSSVFKCIKGPTPTINCKANASTFQALALSPEKTDGFNSSFAIIDECHELPTKVYEVIKQGMSTRDNPLIVMISTAGFPLVSLFTNRREYAISIVESKGLADKSLLPILYELDDGDDPWNERNWYKANPGLGPIKKLEAMREFANKAKKDPSLQLTFFTKDLNLIVKTSDVQWLDAKTIINHEVYSDEQLKKFDNTYVLGGFDLSKTGDLTAFSTLIFDQENSKIVVVTQCWCTQAFLGSPDAERSNAPFKSWINQGFLKISGTHQIDYHDIVEYVLTVFRQHGWIYDHIYYDSYSANYLIDEFSNYGWSKEYCLVPVVQGFKSLSLPMQELKSLLEDKRLVYQNNPMMAWMLSNMMLVQDRNGNWMPDKRDHDSANKIDGPMTVIDALYGFIQNRANYLPDKADGKEES